MNQKEIAFEQLQKKWYPQGFNCTPFLLIPPGSSGFDLKPCLGDTFTHFLYEFKNDFGKMYYDLDELNHLGTIVRSKIKKDKQFLIKTRKQSDLNYSKALQQIKNIPELQWPSLSKEEFLSLIQKAMYLLRSCDD